MSLEILIIGFLIFFIIQLFILFRIVLIIKNFTRILFEIRLILRHHGFNFEPAKKLPDKRCNTCHYCQYRIPYIDMSGKSVLGDFYYKCKKRNIEIDLSDTCKYFKRDYQFK